ncbi:MAG: hypothetical protein H6574_09160 [Lewinellaceae bacterium]|nr:hypothetical protein [Saprospiraceae bacterium]MCB9331236.1 hypothetical protein [Lewinellaceae bacterium]
MKLHLFLACCFIGSSLLAQRTIVGRVVDQDNEPLLGTWVSYLKAPQNHEVVWVKIDGNYALEVPEDCRNLYVSYEWTAEVPLGDSDTTNVIFIDGYNGKLKENIPASSRQYAVQVSGKIAGVEKSKTATVQIKGTETVVQADAEGRFSLLVPPGQDILVFAAENYYKTEIHLGEMSSVYVAMRLYLKQEKKKKRWWQIFKRKN